MNTITLTFTQYGHRYWLSQETPLGRFSITLDPDGRYRAQRCLVFGDLVTAVWFRESLDLASEIRACQEHFDSLVGQLVQPWRPLSELPEHGIVVVWDPNGVVYSQHCHTIREQIREGRTPPLAFMLIPDFKGFGNG